MGVAIRRLRNKTAEECLLRAVSRRVNYRRFIAATELLAGMLSNPEVVSARAMGENRADAALDRLADTAWRLVGRLMGKAGVI